MTVRPKGYELAKWAIAQAYDRVSDAHTLDEAIRCHSELIDLLSIEVMAIRISGKSERAKAELISELSARAEYHRDALDRLTDIVETNGQLVWSFEQ
jgi:transposase InsO family protein